MLSLRRCPLTLPAQWHQWLRYTRRDPPSLEEQQADVIRQAQMKQLARVADAKWASKPSFLDKPRPQPGPATLPRDPAGYVPQTEPEEKKEGVHNAVEGGSKPKRRTEEDKPWKTAQRGGPSEGWQPESWTPTSGPARR